MTACYFTASGNCLYVARRIGGTLLSIPQLMRQNEIVIEDDKDSKLYHFYEKHPDGYKSSVAWDVQKIDLGIAICHFMNMTEGKISIDNPGITTGEDIEYIATVTVD